MPPTAEQRQHAPRQGDDRQSKTNLLPIAAVIGVCLLVATITITAAMLRSPGASGSNVEPSPTVASSVGPHAPQPSSHGSMFTTAWETELPYGTHSSPRLINIGGTPELLISFGDERARAGGIMAVDVGTGKPRWHVETENELFALPIPLTARESGELPWAFAGRLAQLYVVDVRSGRKMWQFQLPDREGRALDIFNFYAGRELGDLNDDGIIDYLVAYGGDFTRAPHEERQPGFLMVINGADGSIIHKMQVPDQRETYLSPLIWPVGDDELVIFGTGGETFPGSLWCVPIQSVRAGNLDGTQRLISNVMDKGAIAPPSFADVNTDGFLDLICAPFDGRMVVISGSTLKPLWQFFPRRVIETQCTPAIGDFDGDGDPDIAYTAQQGVFPDWKRSILRVFDGETGSLLWEAQTSADIAFASPLAVDVDADGRDEIFIVQGNPALFNPRLHVRSNVSRVQIGHVDERRMEMLGVLNGFNAGSGWMGDSDQDGQLEWFLTLMQADGKGSLVRINLGQPVPSRISWGGYLGTRHDGIYSVD